MGTVESSLCKNCGHSKEDHKGTATICMKQTGKDSTELCNCFWFDDGKSHVLRETLEAFVSKRSESPQNDKSAGSSNA